MKNIFMYLILFVFIFPVNVKADYIHNVDNDLELSDYIFSLNTNDDIDNIKKEQEEQKAVNFLIIMAVLLIIFMYVLYKIVKKIDVSDLVNLYGYDGKKIDKNNVPIYRDIPCNKDIYYANALIKLNDFDYKRVNVMGAIILKWVRDNKIVFRNETVGIFNIKTSVIDLTLDSKFDNDIERELFSMMLDASKNGILGPLEFEAWCMNNYDKFERLVDSISNNIINDLKSDGHIYSAINIDNSKYMYLMSDKIYNDSIQLYGLKKYLEEFSRMNTKETIDVHLWEEYLMYAYLFGITDLVNEQLASLYPEVVTKIDFTYDYNTLLFIDRCVSFFNNNDTTIENKYCNK